MLTHKLQVATAALDSPSLDKFALVVRLVLHMSTSHFGGLWLKRHPYLPAQRVVVLYQIV